jgi:hypothetical protein
VCKWYAAALLLGRAPLLFTVITALGFALSSVAHADEAGTFDPQRAPAILDRIAPYVVKVRRGDAWGTGFVFDTPRHVVTSYFIVNSPGDLQVVAADGAARSARVVAWSKADDLAILELDKPISAARLEGSVEPPVAGASVAVLYQPRDPKLEADETGGWNAPVAVFGRIGRVGSSELDLDAHLWGRRGDLGAPVMSPTGRVVGVVSHRSEEQLRVIVTRVERVQLLLAARNRQGEFTRGLPLTGFGGLFVTPLATHGLVGAGIDSGIRLNWFVLELLESFFASDHRPIGDNRFQSTTRVQFELDAIGQLKVSRDAKLFAGPGVQLNLDTLGTIQIAADGTLQDDDRQRVRVRPTATLGIVQGALFIRAVLGFESRVDLGLVFGR